MADQVKDNAPDAEEDDEEGGGKRTRAKVDDVQGGVTITSLMDAMTIILTFLLQNIGSSPIQINENDDLRLANSTSELAPEDTLVVTVTKRWVIVDTQQVTPINDGQIDPSALQSAESAIIPELQQRIEESLQNIEQWNRAMGRETERVLTVVGDHETPYRVLTQVMITAAAAGVQNFKFGVIQEPR